MKKKTAAAETAAGERVVLQPVFGIAPRTYVPVLLAAALLAALFFLLVFPGLAKPGAMVRFAVLPEGTSVRVDGVRAGFAPAEFFVPAGSRTFILRKPHFAARELRIDVPGRVFGSLFFPRRITVSAELQPASPRELLDAAHAEFSSWVLTGDPSAAGRIPAVLSEAAADFRSAKEEDSRLLWDMLRSSAASVNSPGAFADFARAVLLAGSGGNALSPQGLTRAGAFLARLYGSADSAAFWLSAVLPEKAAGTYASSESASAETSRLSARFTRETASPPRTSQAPVFIRTFGGEFARIPGGTCLQGWAAVSDSASPKDSLSPPRSAAVGSFYLKTHEVTEREFAAFIRENPLWAPANRAALVRDGLAEETYLASWNDSASPPSPDLPVREVSHFAARAYCVWLGRKDPDHSYYLPSETEWEYAASLNVDGGKVTSPDAALRPAESGPRGRAGLRSMEGGLWEWCSDGYYPAAYIFPPSEDFPAAERVVRGGSWLSSVTVSTRGSQPPAWCTPYLGFRPAAKKAGS